MNALTTKEKGELTRLEAVVKSGLGTFVEVGDALLKIREGRLYRDSHKTFEDYCRERWEMSKTQANRLIQSSEVIENLAPIGVTPINESQVRPLTHLEPAKQAEVWKRAVETAPDGKVTATHVENVVRESVGKPPLESRKNGFPQGHAPQKADDDQDDEQLEPRRRTAGDRWYESIHRIWCDLNSIRDLGGISKVAAQWSPAERRDYVVQLRQFVGTCTDIISELEKPCRKTA
jgi:hypothetical protein